MTDAQYLDTDFVYVDPKQKTVLGKVEWLADGKAKPLEMKVPDEPVAEEPEEGKKPSRRPRKRRKQYYPWCSYRTAKKVYHVEGKHKDEEEYEQFDTVLNKALAEAYWD